MVLAVILGSLSLLVLPRLVRWLGDNGSVGRTAAAAHTPSVVAEGAQSIVVRDPNGGKAWEFSADRITISSDKLYCTATDVRRGVLYRKGRPFLKLQARQVRLNQQTRDLIATGTVSASGPDGFSVRTERADWQHQVERLTCPDALHATIRGLKIDTKNAFYDARAGQLHCPQVVQVTAERATMKGSNAVADPKTRQVKFNQGVQISVKPK